MRYKYRISIKLPCKWHSSVYSIYEAINKLKLNLDIYGLTFKFYKKSNNLLYIFELSKESFKADVYSNEVISYTNSIKSILAMIYYLSHYINFSLDKLIPYIIDLQQLKDESNIIDEKNYHLLANFILKEHKKLEELDDELNKKILFFNSIILDIIKLNKRILLSNNEARGYIMKLIAEKKLPYEFDRNYLVIL